MQKAISRHPGENRGPEKYLIFKTLDAGFRRHDEKKASLSFLHTLLLGV